MSNVTKSLSFRLISASFIVVSVFIFIAGFTVIKISQDSIKVGATDMARNMADDVRRLIAKDADINAVADALIVMKIKKSGSVWLMDKDGYLLYHPDPLYREEYISRKKDLGNVIVTLQYAKPRFRGGGHKEKLIDIIKKYEEGFGTYQQYGETRVIAFQVLKKKGWLIGLDEPVATAYSELNRIRKYIFYTGLISAVLIMVFTLLAIRIIVKPYYREVEDLNVKLHNANLGLTEANKELEISNKKLKTLYEISISMQETLSLKDILELIISGAQEVIYADRINIMLPDRKESFLECRAAIGAGDRELSEIRLPLSPKGGALSAAYKRRQIIKVGPEDTLPPNLKLSPPYSEDPFLRSSAFVVLPMVVKNKSVGAIAIDNKFSKKPITDDMVNLIQIFANQAAVAVDNARLYEELKRNLDELDTRVDQLSIVNQISNTMQKMVKKKEMLGFILRGIKESMGFDALMIALLDKEEEKIRGEVSVGVDEGRAATLEVSLGEEDNVMAEVFSQGNPSNYSTDKSVGLMDILTSSMTVTGLKPNYGEYIEGSKASVALIPLRVLDNVVGIIILGRFRSKPVIIKKEMELLMLFANTAGLAVERAEFYEKVQEGIESLEITDHVTKLFIFKYGQQRVREEMIKSKDSSKPLSIAMLGIDNFKDFNERCGQELGDKALAEIASLVKMSISDNDLAFRYGGRLICCVFPGKSIIKASNSIEKLHQLISDHHFTGSSGVADQKMTVSIGICEFKPGEEMQDPSEILKTAMALLHQAESTGGNKLLTG